MTVDELKVCIPVSRFPHVQECGIRNGALEVTVLTVPNWLAWIADEGPPMHWQEDLIAMCHRSSIGVFLTEQTRIVLRLDKSRINVLREVLDAFAVTMRWENRPNA